MMAERKIFTREEMKEIFREVLAEHHELIGMPIETADDRTKLREDAMWLRAMRLRADGVASKIGYAILAAIVGLAITIFAAGLKIKVGH